MDADCKAYCDSLDKVIAYLDALTKNADFIDLAELEDGNLRRAAVTKAIEASDSSGIYHGFTMQWLTFTVGANNNSFKRYAPALAFDDQIIKAQFTTINYKIQYSHYYRNDWNNTKFYFDVSGEYSSIDNFSDLTKNEIEQTQTGNSGAITRKATDKFSAYSGEYLTNIPQLSLRGNIYGSKGQADAWLLHAFPEVVLKEGSFPAYNCGVGVVLFFKTKEKETSVFNIEPFIKFNDLPNLEGSEYSVFGRNEIGLLLTTPISFNPK